MQLDPALGKRAAGRIDASLDQSAHVERCNGFRAGFLEKLQSDLMDVEDTGGAVDVIADASQRDRLARRLKDGGSARDCEDHVIGMRGLEYLDLIIAIDPLLRSRPAVRGDNEASVRWDHDDERACDCGRRLGRCELRWNRRPSAEKEKNRHSRSEDVARAF